MEEKLDIYTREGKYLGVRSRAECHTENPGFYHKPAWTWVYNSKGEILIQKRSMKKKRYAGCWDAPCSGHVDAGETSLVGAIREAKEEIGLDVDEKDIQFMGEFILDDDYWEIGQIFFIKTDKKIDEFVLQEDEVDEVKWINFDDFKKIFSSDIWAPCPDNYRNHIIQLFEKVLNKKQGKVIAVCGKIASGKSYYANILKEKENAIVFSVDELTYYMVDNRGGEDYTDLTRRATNYFKAKSVELVNYGENVILDLGLWKKELRSNLREFYKKQNINFEIHYVNVDDETWEKNIAKRNKRIDAGDKGCDFYVTEGLIKKVKANWEEPEKNEIDVLYKVKY